MRLLEVLGGSSLTHGRASSSVAAAGVYQDGTTRRERDALEKGGGEPKEARGGYCEVGDGVTVGVASRRSACGTPKPRPDSKVSLFWRMYGSGPSGDTPTASGNVRKNKKETKMFGLGRRFSFRSSSASKQVFLFHRSNTLPVKGSPGAGDKSSVQPGFVPVIKEEDLNDSLGANRSETNEQIGNHRAAHQDKRGPSCSIFTQHGRNGEPRRKCISRKTNPMLTHRDEECAEARVSQFICAISSEEGSVRGGLSRGSSECTLRQEPSELTSHYLSASEIAVSEVTSCDLPLVDLTLSDATPHVSPDSSTTSTPSVTVGAGLDLSRSSCSTMGSSILPMPASHPVPCRDTKPPGPILDSLAQFLASFRAPEGLLPRETHERATSDSSITPANSLPRDWLEYNPSSTSTSSGASSKREQESSGGKNLDTKTRSRCHRCPQCQVNFLTGRQLLEHWSVVHTHDLLQLTLSPLHHPHPHGDHHQVNQLQSKPGKHLRHSKEEEDTWIMKTPTQHDNGSPVLEVSLQTIA
ncbi:uncharacterized protein [Procambarus clarkii]|uniref:uncharacterized protein n=1 Tax=Procambarus clarkii TaxID=6728 RepID=UPI003743E99D